MGEIERQRAEIERQIGEIQRQRDRHRDGGQKQRDIADNKNPKQSWVVQLVSYKGVRELQKVENSCCKEM